MKKALVSLTLVLLLLATAIAPAFAYDMYYVKTGNGGPLLVREGPGKNYKVVSKLTYGSEVAVEGFEGNWARLVWGGSGQAYVMKKFLSATKPGAKPSSSASSDSYASFKTVSFDILVKPRRTSGYVNVRWAPSTKATIQAKYFNGDQLHVIAESRNWYQVFDTANNRCGFIKKSFTTKVD